MVLGVYSSWGGIPLAIKTHFGVWTVFSLFESWNDNSGQFGLAIRFQTAVVMPTSLPQGSFLSAIFSMWLMPLVPWGFPLPGSLSFLHSLFFLVWPSFLPSLLLFHWCSTIYIFATLSSSSFSFHAPHEEEDEKQELKLLVCYLLRINILCVLCI